MSTLNDSINFARSIVQTDINGLTDANAIIYANEALVDFHRQLTMHGIDASQTQESYVNTITPPTSGNGSTFLYPSDCLALKTIEVNFTDTTPQNYLLATQVEVANLAGQTSFSWLRINQSTREPKFDDRGDQYEIFPAFTGNMNLTNAIRLFYFLKPTLFAATSDTLSYPESLDITILGWRIAADYSYALGSTTGAGRSIRLTGDSLNTKYQERVTQFIETLGRGSQQPITATTLQISGYEF